MWAGLMNVLTRLPSTSLIWSRQHQHREAIMLLGGGEWACRAVSTKSMQKRLTASRRRGRHLPELLQVLIGLREQKAMGDVQGEAGVR